MSSYSEMETFLEKCKFIKEKVFNRSDLTDSSLQLIAACFVLAT